MPITHEDFGCNIEEFDEGLGSVIVPSGPKGDPGATGIPGYTPYIDSKTGYWFINGVSTGIAATGPQGVKGDKGDKGDTGNTPSATDIVSTLIDSAEFYTSMKTLKKAIYPLGLICMWSGSPETYFNSNGTGKLVGNIDMRGWGLCETRTSPSILLRGNAGQGYYYVNGAPFPIPDLSSRFIVSHGIASIDSIPEHSPDYQFVRRKGGSRTATFRINADNLPEHTHATVPLYVAAGEEDVNHSNAPAATVTKAGTRVINTGKNTTTNSNITINTVPPFYVLAFIMKIDEIEEA